MMANPDPKKVAKQFLAQRGESWAELFFAPYPRGLTRYLPVELDVVWWRAGEMFEGDIYKFIPEGSESAFKDESGYQVGPNQRVRADKVYLR